MSGITYDLSRIPLSTTRVKDGFNVVSSLNHPIRLANDVVIPGNYDVFLLLRAISRHDSVPPDGLPFARIRLRYEQRAIGAAFLHALMVDKPGIYVMVSKVTLETYTDLPPYRQCPDCHGRGCDFCTRCGQLIVPIPIRRTAHASESERIYKCDTWMIA
jgi:hypothetical protein